MHITTSPYYLFIKKTLLFLPLIIFIAAINFFYAPQGFNAVKKDAAFFSTKDIIVFGSSRSFQINLTPYLKHYTSFSNHACGKATIEDDVAIYKVFKSKPDKLPKVLILECSAWCLNFNFENKKVDWRYKAYDQIFSFLLLFAPGRFKIGLEKAALSLFTPAPLDKPYDPPFARIIEEKNKDLSLKPGMRFTELDADTVKHFETFIEQLLADGIRVIFFLPPYHPTVYKEIIQNPACQGIPKAEQFFRQYAQQHSIETAGAYNPALCACDETDFWDWHHTYESSTPKIFKHLLESL